MGSTLILAYGLDPSELTIVMEARGEANRFVVLDGNRRLTALRALENPEFLVDVVPNSVLNAVRRLAQQYQGSPIAEIPCVVYKERADANHWIELRHTGELGGAGPVLWGPDESDRFRTRTGGRPNITSQALDFLEARGDITTEQRRQDPTTMRRILESPAIRPKLGLEYSDKTLRAVGEPDKVAKALLYLVTEITENRLDVTNVYTKEQREDFASDLPIDIVVSHTLKRGAGIPLEDVVSAKGRGRAKGSSTPRPPRPRAHLIPSDCALQVEDLRCQEIERELRRLRLEDYPNAVSVLFRVFLELSADAYVEKVTLGTNVYDPLGTKLQNVTRDLVFRKKLTGQQAKPVRRAAQRDSYLGPSITGMNDYIHNQHTFPGPSDLRSDWNNLQPWFMAVWSS